MSKTAINILLVHDEPAVYQLIERSLSTAAGDVSFNLDMARSLNAGIEAVSGEAFDVVLLVLSAFDNQPIQALERIRNANPTIPVIVLVSAENEELGIEAMRKGAECYLVKGESLTDRNQLVEIIAKYLLPRAQGRRPAALDSISGPPQKARDDYPMVSELADDPEMFVVAERFVKSLPSTLKEIADAVDGSDMDELRRLVHSLMGASGTAGFPILYEKAAVVEELILSDKIDSLKSVVEELDNLCRRAKAAAKT